MKRDACIVEIVDYKILKFKDIASNLSDFEVVGDYVSWREEYMRFFKKG